MKINTVISKNFSRLFSIAKITRKSFCCIGLLIVIECFCASIAAAEYQRIKDVDPNDPMAVAVYRLDNGLLVYLTHNSQTPDFYAEIAIRAGAKFDPPDATGLAHYMEHLLFKGTRHFGTLDYEQEKPHLDRITELYEQHFCETDPQKRKEIYAEINKESQEASRYAIPNELDSMYDMVGGSWLNAHTGFEEIVYQVKVPSNRLRQWAAIESERFAHPVFRLFQTELEVVYEEKNRTLDDKYWIIHEAVMRALFKNHPYGRQSLVGSIEHLKNPSLRKLYGYCDTYYVPNNMAIVISGDIDGEEAIRVIDEYFSSWKQKRLPRPQQWREKPLKGVERVHVNYLGEEYVLLAFRTARFKHRDFEPLVLFDMLLGNSAISLINLDLVLPQKIRSAGSYAQIYNDYGVQFLWGVPKEGQSLEEVEALLLVEVERLKKGEFDQSAINDIVTNINIEHKRDLESNDLRVSEMRDSFVSFVTWKHWLGQIERFQRVEKNDIIRIAKEYFKGNYVAGYRHNKQHDIPAVQKPELAAIEIDDTRQSAFAKQVLSMPVDEIDPDYIDPDSDYQTVQDENGIRYYYTANPLNDLFTFTISFDVGSRQNNVLGPAIGFLNKSGTRSLSPQELERAWYGLGSRVALSAGEDEATITLAGLDEHFEASLALLAEALFYPTSDQATLAEFKEIVRVQRRDMKEDLSSILQALVEFNLYGNESAYLSMVPMSQLEAMSIEEFFGAIKDLFTYTSTMSYVGSRPLEEVRALVGKYLKGSVHLRSPPAYQPRRLRLPEMTEIYFFDKAMAQAHVAVSSAAENYDEKTTPAGQMFNSYFGGMSGLIFQELREARALAYSAWGHYDFADRANGQNVMRLGIATQADKTTEALGVVAELLDRTALTPERFLQAQESLLNHYRAARVTFRDVVWVVRAWERLGLTPDPRRERFATIKAMTIEQLEEFYERGVAHRLKLISIVGDKNKIKIPSLQEIGRIVFVTAEDIFVD